MFGIKQKRSNVAGCSVGGFRFMAPYTERSELQHEHRSRGQLRRWVVVPICRADHHALRS